MKKVALYFGAIVALEFIGLESASIALAIPRYVMVATISALGDGNQTCTFVVMSLNDYAWERVSIPWTLFLKMKEYLINFTMMASFL